jgi:flagellin-like protein
MQLTALHRDEEAVSPVIGVILMVAITVILAAVIGTFVLGLGGELENNAPQASFTFDYDDTANQLTITHDGGASIDTAELRAKSDDGQTAAWDASSDWSELNTGADAEVSAGDNAVMGQVDDTETVRIIWESSNGGDTATLGKWTGPNA